MLNYVGSELGISQTHTRQPVCTTLSSMKPDFQITIQIKPMPNKSVQFVRPTKGRPFISAYKPTELREYQNSITASLVAAGACVVRGPVLVLTDYVFELPKALCRVRTPVVERTWHDVRPDYDNLDKAVNDAIKQYAFQDDGRICVKLTRKRYGSQGETASITIKIWSLKRGARVVLPGDEGDEETAALGEHALSVRLEDIQGGTRGNTNREK